MIFNTNTCTSTTILSLPPHENLLVSYVFLYLIPSQNKPHKVSTTAQLTSLHSIFNLSERYFSRSSINPYYLLYYLFYYVFTFYIFLFDFHHSGVSGRVLLPWSKVFLFVDVYLILLINNHSGGPWL